MTTNLSAGQVWETRALPGDTAGIKILVMQVHDAWYVDYVYLRDLYRTEPNGLPTVQAYGNPMDRFTREFQLVAESMSDFVNRDVQ